MATRSPVAGSWLSIVAPTAAGDPRPIDVVLDVDDGSAGLGHRCPLIASMVRSTAVSSSRGVDGQRRADLDDVLLMTAAAERGRRVRTPAVGSPAHGQGLARRWPVGDDLDADEQAEAADLADMGRAGEARVQAARERSAQCCRAVGQSRSCRKASIAARPAARLTAFPMNVEVWAPAAQ